MIIKFLKLEWKLIILLIASLCFVFFIKTEDAYNYLESLLLEIGKIHFLIILFVSSFICTLLLLPITGILQLLGGILVGWPAFFFHPFL